MRTLLYLRRLTFLMIIQLQRFFKILLFLTCCSLCGQAQTADSIKPLGIIDSSRLTVGNVSVKRGGKSTAGLAIKRAVLSVPQDFVQIGKVFTRDWRQTAAYTGGIALLVLADKPVTKFYQDEVEKAIDYKLPRLTGRKNTVFFNGNDAYLNFSIMALYGGSLVAKYDKGQRAALNSIKALTYSYLIVQVGIKAIFARQRPDATLSNGIDPYPPYTTNPHHFFNFRKISFREGPNATSFPSMHATSYFAVARVMAQEFDNYWIPYGAVSFLFLADLKSHQHWVGDMVAGGILGSVIGQGIVLSSKLWDKKQKEKSMGLNRHRKFKYNYQVLPRISSQMTGLTMLMSL